MLTDDFRDALMMALDTHSGDVRKSTTVPYMAHLMAVTALVLEMGGDESSAIAALLHDAIEDGGGMEMATEIRGRFGERVLGLVLDVSEPVGDPRPPWRTRKQAYLDHLAEADPDSLRIALADKLHNARSTLRLDEETRWDRFNSPVDDQEWWYRSVVDALTHRTAGMPELEPFMHELSRIVDELFGRSANWSSIVMQGQDGSVMTYHAVSGPEYDVREVGWVLVVEGAAVEVPPQPLTPVDVMGDLLTMVDPDSQPVAALDVLTRAMVAGLRERDDIDATRRADELAAELEDAKAMLAKV